MFWFRLRYTFTPATLVKAHLPWNDGKIIEKKFCEFQPCSDVMQSREFFLIQFEIRDKFYKTYFTNKPDFLSPESFD